MAIADTRQKILEVGKREFLLKGFKDASLNRIVAEAGFTKGAFYGYYPDKAALFDDLVKGAADGLTKRFRQAQNAHFELIPAGRAAESRELSTAYLREFIAYVYDNFDAFKLIVCRSEGTKYAGYIDGLVELEVERTARYYELLREKGMLRGEVSGELHRMITRAYFTAAFETVAKDMPRERAYAYTEELAAFFNSGWEGLLRLV